MSKLTSFIVRMIVLALALPAIAMACPHSETQFICPGDPVADANGSFATVIGVNAFQYKASIKYDNPYVDNAVVDIHSLAIRLGCVGYTCVGDAVTDSNGTTGKIAAVNPFNRSGVIKYDNPYMDNAVVALRNLALGRGCLEGYCVGDVAFDSNGTPGRIFAINYESRRVALKYANPYVDNSVSPIEQVSLGLGCVLGSCVGDRGSDADGNSATVVGINPYNRTLVLKYDNPYVDNSVVPAANFMNSEYCVSYGDAVRGYPYFIDQGPGRVQYVGGAYSGGFQFSVSRP